MKSSVIEPIMSPINPTNGDGRLVIHLLQTRHPLPEKPEHHSHWESIIMPPPIVPPTGISFGTVIETKDGFHYYDMITNHDRQMIIKPLDTITISGRGSRSSYHRMVHQIRSLVDTTGPQLAQIVSISLGSLPKNQGNVVIYSLPNIKAVTSPSSDDDLKQYNDLLPSIVVPLPPPVVSTIMSSKRQRTPTKPPAPATVAAASTPMRKLRPRSIPAKKKKKVSSDESSDSDAVVVVPVPKPKKVVPKIRAIATPKEVKSQAPPVPSVVEQLEEKVRLLTQQLAAKSTPVPSISSSTSTSMIPYVHKDYNMSDPLPLPPTSLSYDPFDISGMLLRHEITERFNKAARELEYQRSQTADWRRYALELIKYKK